jgi:4-deoxy-L-threo-5-hexosulose-uronate ketol-isomerase
MGPNDETRRLAMKDQDLMVSPEWSIHSGVGSKAYRFCCGTGGENQDHADMYPIVIEELR